LKLTFPVAEPGGITPTSFQLNCCNQIFFISPLCHPSAEE